MAERENKPSSSASKFQWEEVSKTSALQFEVSYLFMCSSVVLGVVQTPNIQTSNKRKKSVFTKFSESWILLHLSHKFLIFLHNLEVSFSSGYWNCVHRFLLITP